MLKKQPVTSDLRKLIEQCLQNTPQFGFQVRLEIGNMSKKKARGKLPAAPGNRNKSAQERSKREKKDFISAHSNQYKFAQNTPKSGHKGRPESDKKNNKKSKKT